MAVLLRRGSSHGRGRGDSIQVLSSKVGWRDERWDGPISAVAAYMLAGAYFQWYGEQALPGPS